MFNLMFNLMFVVAKKIGMGLLPSLYFILIVEDYYRHIDGFPIFALLESTDP